MSVSTLSNLFDMGSYQTAWTMLHRYRSVMVLPDRDKLSGEVEADESAFGGENKPGKRGRANLHFDYRVRWSVAARSDRPVVVAGRSRQL